MSELGGLASGIQLVFVVVDLVCSVVDWLDSVLPTSALPDMDLSGFSVYLGWLNWLLPVGSIVELFGVWCAAIAGAAGAKFVTDRLFRSVGSVGELAGVTFGSVVPSLPSGGGE